MISQEEDEKHQRKSLNVNQHFEDSDLFQESSMAISVEDFNSSSDSDPNYEEIKTPQKKSSIQPKKNISKLQKRKK